MKTKKVWDGIKSILGITPEQNDDQKYRPMGLPPRPGLPQLVRRWGQRGWRRFALRRRALGPNVKRRAARMEFIRQSQLQGIEIRRSHRERQLERRAGIEIVNKSVPCSLDSLGQGTARSQLNESGEQGITKYSHN